MAGNDWMSGVSDDTCIAKMAIPGTHDTGAYQTDEWVPRPMTYAQFVDIPAQLGMGVRALDLRVGGNYYWWGGSGFSLYHGPFQLPDSAESAVGSVIAHLQNNPTEFIILMLEFEPWGGLDWSSSFNTWLNGLLGDRLPSPISLGRRRPPIPAAGCVWLALPVLKYLCMFRSGSQPSLASNRAWRAGGPKIMAMDRLHERPGDSQPRWPTVGELRGKVLVLSRFKNPDPTHYSTVGWSGNFAKKVVDCGSGLQVQVQDLFDKPGLDAKKKAVKDAIGDANRSSDRKLLHLNYTSYVVNYKQPREVGDQDGMNTWLGKLYPIVGVICVDGAKNEVIHYLYSQTTGAS